MLSVDALGCNEDVERKEKTIFDKLSRWFAGIGFLVYVAWVFEFPDDLKGGCFLADNYN